MNEAEGMRQVILWGSIDGKVLSFRRKEAISNQRDEKVETNTLRKPGGGRKKI